MTFYNLGDIIFAIMHGDIKEGDILESNSGFRVTYRDGVLSWLTSGGYIGSAVTITEDSLQEVFAKVKSFKEKRISFTEALPLIAEGKEVRVVVEGSREYIISDLDDMDEMIQNREFFVDVIEADYFVEVEVAEKEEKAEQSLRNRLTNILTMPVVVDASKLDELFAEMSRELRKSKKLLPHDAYNIHHLYHFVKKPVKEIAEQYRVSERMIYYVLDGTHWAEIHEQFHRDYDLVSDDYVS
jgi:hypothetical protein